MGDFPEVMVETYGEFIKAYYFDLGTEGMLRCVKRYPFEDKAFEVFDIHFYTRYQKPIGFKCGKGEELINLRDWLNEIIEVEKLEK